MSNSSALPTHLRNAPPKPLPNRLWELEATGRAALPPSTILKEYFAKAANDTPLPSAHFVSRGDSSAEQASFPRAPASGPIHTAHAHSTPSIVDYIKSNLTICPMTQQPNLDTRVLWALVEEYLRISAPRCEAAVKEWTSCWPFAWYACDVKTGLDWYNDILENIPELGATEILSMELFSMAFVGPQPPKGAVTYWQNRLADPRIRAWFLKDVELGKNPQGLFRNYLQMAKIGQSAE